MRVLSIDQSLNSTGYCIWDNGLLYDFGVIKPPKELEQHIKLFHTITELERIIKEENISTIVLEGLSFASSSISVRILGAVYFNILILAYRFDIVWEEVTPTSLKKFATGNGKAFKEDMWKVLPEKVQQKIEVEFKAKNSGKFDICDSFHLGKYYYEKIKGENYVG